MLTYLRADNNSVNIYAFRGIWAGNRGILLHFPEFNQVSFDEIINFTVHDKLDV
jgi:hypothetical protein